MPPPDGEGLTLSDISQLVVAKKRSLMALVRNTSQLQVPRGCWLPLHQQLGSTTGARAMGTEEEGPGKSKNPDSWEAFLLPPRSFKMIKRTQNHWQ